MKPTQIDAVAMVRRIRDANAERLKNATDEERIAFIREGARRVHAQLAEQYPGVLRPKRGDTT